MRLIGQIVQERQAYLFYSFLKKKGIENSYEPFLDPELKKQVFQIWILDEDRVEESETWLKSFNQNPKDPEFAVRLTPEPPPPIPSLSESIVKDEEIETPRFQVKVHIRPKRPLTHPLNNLLIIICVILFFWNGMQEGKIKATKGVIATQILMTPLQQALLYDYPKSMAYLEQLVDEYPLNEVKELKDLPKGAQELIQKSEEAPAWKGFFKFILHWPRQGWIYIGTIPMFEKIQEGEVWRLFSPILMHASFLHILFNMAWLWILGAQIEQRAGKLRILFLILIVAVVSNTAQYLVGGPFFFGFSGVIVGMVGFIWVRQKLAPWEGYPLNRATVIFILLFVLAMFVLEIIAVTMQFLGITDLSPNIANTAHIVGGLTGMLIGRIPLFSKRGKG
jgi:GlpG protein